MSIDLTRSIIRSEYGHFTVDANASFEAGQIAQFGSDGEVVTCDGTAPMGVLKWNKTSTLTSTIANEALVLNDTSATLLDHANVSNVKVKSATTGGTTYTVTTDYTVNTTNGTVTRVDGQAIANGATVYVSYTYQLSTAEAGNKLNFYLHHDDTAGSGKITVIQGYGTIYTDQYDSSKSYAINDTVYPTISGKFTNVADYNKPFGKVISVPSASDPYLGIEGNFIADR